VSLHSGWACAMGELSQWSLDFYFAHVGLHLQLFFQVLIHWSESPWNVMGDFKNMLPNDVIVKFIWPKNCGIISSWVCLISSTPRLATCNFLTWLGKISKWGLWWIWFWQIGLTLWHYFALVEITCGIVSHLDWPTKDIIFVVGLLLGYSVQYILYYFVYANIFT
jgi:hypothetical protein